MARKRNYRAEYAARDARAKAAGFSSYAQQRKARSNIKRHFDVLVERDALSKAPSPRSKAGRAEYDLLEEIYLYTAARGIKFERGNPYLERTKKGRRLLAELHAMYPEPEKFYPVARGIY